jgi:imidazolonepropionase-like amidohydrolase
MVRFGMTPLQAIQSATVTAADVMGLGYEVGKIEAGYAADFVAVKGNPLENIELLEEPAACYQGWRSLSIVGVMASGGDGSVGVMDR